MEMVHARQAVPGARRGGAIMGAMVAVLLLLPLSSWAAHTTRIVEGPAGTPNPVASGGAVQCTVRAADSEERELKYTWSCAAGSFNDPNAAAPVWTAPQNDTGADARYTIQVMVTTEPKGLEVILGAPVARGEFEVVVRPGQAPVVTGPAPDLQLSPDWILLSFDGDNAVMQIEPRADQQCIVAAVINAGQVEARDVRVRFVVSRFGREPLTIGTPVAVGNIAPGASATASVIWDMKGRHAEQRTITAEAFTPDGLDANPEDNRAAITANIYFALAGERAFSWPRDGYSFDNFAVEPTALAEMVTQLVARVAQQRAGNPTIATLMAELLGPTAYLTLSNYLTAGAAKGTGGHSMGMAASAALHFTGQMGAVAGKAGSEMSLEEAHQAIHVAQVAQLPWLLTSLSRRGDYLQQELTTAGALTRARSLLRDQSRPAMVRLLGEGWGHSALAYKIIEVEGRDPVLYVYDPNAPATDRVQAHHVMPQIVLGEESWSTPGFMGYETAGARYIGAHEVFAQVTADEAEGLVRPMRRMLYDWAAQSAQSGKLLVTMVGPADMLMVSGSGKRLGQVQGQVVNEFAGAEVLSQGGVQMYNAPPRERFAVQMQGTGEGELRFSVLRGESDTRAAVVAFSGLRIRRGGTATCTLNGDGTVEGFTLDGNPVAPTASGVLTSGDQAVWRSERNTPPSMPTVTIEPEHPSAEDDLVCSAEGSRDPDGDAITYKFQWYRNGNIQNLGTSATIASRFTSELDVWRCVVTPTDGKNDGPTGEATVVIGGADQVGDWRLIEHERPRYSLSIPGSWREDTPTGENVVQLVRKRGTRSVFVEIHHSRVPEGLTGTQFEALALGYQQRVPYLQTQTGSQSVDVAGGLGHEYEFTGVLETVPVRTLVRHVMVGADYFVLFGVTEIASQDLNWSVVRQVLDSFSRAGGAIWGFAITAPTEGAVVTQPLTITGTAQPGSRVRVSVNYWFRIIVESWALLTQKEVTANDAGVWELKDVGLDVSIFGRSRKYEVVAELLGADGAVLSTQKVQVNRN